MPKNDELYLVLILAGFAFFAWRMGWFDRLLGRGQPKPANKPSAAPVEACTIASPQASYEERSLIAVTDMEHLLYERRHRERSNRLANKFADAVDLDNAEQAVALDKLKAKVSAEIVKAD